MFGFLRQLQLDRLSFWLGFLAGSLIWWLLGRFRPFLSQLIARLKAQAQTARQELQTSTEVRLNNDTIRYAQQLHVAAPLFSLDELAISPRLIAPPPPIEPDLAPPGLDITEYTIPYMPDWPEFASIYGAPTLSLVEALQEDVSIAVIGEPGSGKTVALATLAIRMARQTEDLGTLAGRVPLLVHAADLLISNEAPEPEDDQDGQGEEQEQHVLQALIEAVALHASTLTQARLPAFLHTAFEVGRVVLLLDGLDELPAEEFKEVEAYLGKVLQAYPQTQSVLAASPEQQPGLSQIGFEPLALTLWDEEQRAAFIQRWSKLWTRYIADPQEEQDRSIEPAVLNGWLLNDISFLTPLEVTLKVWATYAGDLLGPRATDAIEAYIRRMSASTPGSRPVLEQAACLMVLNQSGRLQKADIKDINRLLNIPDLDEAGQEQEENQALETAEAENEAEDFEDLDFDPSELHSPDSPGTMKPRSAIQRSELMVPRPGDRFSFSHPVLLGYLAAQGLAQDHKLPANELDALKAQLNWTGKNQTLKYLAAQDRQAQWVEDLLKERGEEPLLNGLFLAAHWLRIAPEEYPWRAQVLRLLAGCLQDDGLAVGLRARAASALATSGSSSVSILFRRLLDNSHPEVRQIAAIASGASRDVKAVPQLSELLRDGSPNVQRAACLALVEIGHARGLEAVASALLNGEENLRRFAAEALANHPAEGHPTLEEGSALEDILVRRAVVSGLMRVNQPWAIELLKKMQLEDEQWVVKNAATQALEEIEKPNAHVPRAYPPLTELPWLIAFAGEKGIGVVPGKPAYDLVLLAIKDGSEEQKLAALQYVSRHGDESAVLPVYQEYFSSRGDTQEAALHVLWRLQNSGIELPPPIQFGLN
jgi:HEAT repeat protein